MSLEFEQLPLIEVVIRLAPANLIPIRLEWLHRLAGELEKRFPRLTDLEALTPGIGVQSLELGFGQTLGARFSNEETGITLIVQPNIIQLSWQKSAGGAPYPRFETLLVELREAVSSVDTVSQSRLEGGGRGRLFRAANMAYTNLIETSGQPLCGEVRRYLNNRLMVEMMHPEGRFFEESVSWRDEYGTDVRVQARASGLEKDVVLTTVAGRLFEPDAWPEAMLRANRESLLVLFKAILTDHALNEWGYRE